MSETTSILVSVIIPAYNSEKYLIETLQSVAAQTLKQFECIVVDNGSTDQTREIVQSFVTHDARFSYHYCEQNGVSFARNLAVSLSKGKYILPLDSDDKIADTYLQKAANILENNRDIKLVYCNAELFGAAKGKWNLPDYNFKNLLIQNSVFCSSMFRKVDFLTTKGYNENMKEGFEDWDFWIGYLDLHSKVHKIEEVLFYYRIRKHSRNNILDSEKQLRLRKQIYSNHKDVYNKLFSIPELTYTLYLNLAECKQIKESPEFKLGRFLLKPLRILKKLMS